MYVTTWAYSGEVTSDVHEKEEQYKKELLETGFIQEKFEQAENLEAPTQELQESFYDKFMMLESEHIVTARLSTAEGGVMNNLYITVKDVPNNLEDAEALARAIKSAGQEYGGTRAEITDYTNSNEISVQLLVNFNDF